MNSQTGPSNGILRRIASLPWAHHVIVPVLFFVFVIFFVDFRSQLEYSSDEGIFLMQGLLINEGHVLYEDISNDQTPLMSFVLAGAFDLFGNNVSVGRLVTLLFSTVLIWGAYEIMLPAWGKSTAAFACLLLLVVPSYLLFSVSVVVALPSITFAVLSLLFLVRWHEQDRTAWLVLSGAMLALGALTKLVAGFTAPVFAAGIAINSFRRFKASASWRDLFLPGFAWTAGLVTLFLAGIYYFVGLEHIDQLLNVHLLAVDESFYAGREYSIHYYFQDAWPVVLLAGIGLVESHRRRQGSMLYLGGWVVGGYILFLFHRPVWSHHQLYITVPAALLGGIGISKADAFLREMFRGRLQARHAAGVIAVLGIFFAFLPPTLPGAFDYVRWPPSLRTRGLQIDQETAGIIALMRDYAPETNWVVTDKPMLAFITGLPVPPELALMSEKQFNTGLLTEEQVLTAVRAYHPEQILIGRFDFRMLKAHLGTDYTLIQAVGDLELFIRTDLLDP